MHLLLQTNLGIEKLLHDSLEGLESSANKNGAISICLKLIIYTNFLYRKRDQIAAFSKGVFEGENGPKIDSFFPLFLKYVN